MMKELEKSDPSDSSCEADEQVRTIGHGVGGATGRGQGEHARAAHTPDTEPGERVTGA
jgi:hypothetical protein